MKKIIIVLVTIIALLLIVIGVLIFKPNDEKKYQNKSIFLSSIKEIYKTVINQYNNIKYFANIDGKSCDSDITTNLDYEGLNYYYGFDNNGNVNKIYAYNDKYMLELEKDNISIDELNIALYKDVKNNVYIKDYDNNFKLSCEGKING